MIRIKLLFQPLSEDLHVEDAEEAKPPSLAPSEAGLLIDTHTSIIECQPLYGGLQFLGFTLIEWIYSSKHHWLKNEP